MSVTSEKRVQFKQWPCVVRFARYANNGRLAIQLVHARNGNLVATATINLPEISLAHNEVIIKDYSENKGMLEALVSAGIVEETGVRVSLSFGISAAVCRVLVDAPA